MSLKSWKDEYYPVPASEAEDPLEHSILKWTGLLKKNIKKHELTQSRNGGCLYEDITELYEKYSNCFNIDASTCALCVRYLPDDLHSCPKCPLNKYLGGRCDMDGPYIDFIYRHDARPMLRALKATKKMLEKEDK